ncbi:MAG: alpha-E domain-containing protein [Eubacterium sp.]|nr:alpha-E domain-containing protein [Eubacterium sp.]
MGIISVEQLDRLYWLGRYVERVYTTTCLYSTRYDIMIDGDSTSYADFCRNLEIPNIYTSPEDFRYTYAYSEEDENSIFSNLNRAYDNAIELRETIGSEALSYIQLAIYDMNKAKISDAPLIDLQKVMDNLHAFWGVIDDEVDDERCRNTMLIGKRVERIDLYGRLKLDRKAMTREVQRLAGRIDRSAIHYQKSMLEELQQLVEAEPLDYHHIVQDVERIRCE